MTLTPTYTVVNTAGVAQPTVDLLLGVASEAFRLWGNVLAGSANLSVRMEITTAVPSGRADGNWGNGQTVGSAGGFTLAEGAPAYELMSGQNAAGSGQDVILRFNPDYLQNELYLDPTPQTRGDTPTNRTDGLSVLLHEIAHSLGFTGYYNEASDTFASNSKTPYDQHISLIGGEVYFTGANTTAVYGGPVALTNNNYAHYGNTNAYPGTSTDPLTGLMNGVVFYRGYSYGIGDLDLAFLADMGLGTIRDDVLTVQGLPTLRGGLGNDTITGDAQANRLYGDEGNDVIAGGLAADTLFGGVGNDRLNGDDGDDVLVGENGADQLYGGLGADTLLGGADDDTLDGGAGANTLQGGTGNDTYLVSNTSESVYEVAGEGTDTVRSSLSTYTLSANVENLEFNGTPAGSLLFIGNAEANTITGGAFRDDLYGRDGDDRLVDGGGTAGQEDTLIGSIGNDTYVVSLKGDSTLEYAGEGTDTVQTAIGIYALQANVENLTFADNAQHDAGVGNELGNQLRGGTGADALFGREGDDTLYGGTGAANTLLGQQGNDAYVVQASGDSVYEVAGEGTDTVLAGVASFTLPDNVENLIYTGSASFTGIGNVLANQISGGAGADFLSGLDGDDTITGGAGADLMLGGAGNDSFIYTGVETGGYDRITDFTAAGDRILLLPVAFGHPATFDFRSGPGVTAASATPTFLYDTDTGIVRYDPDGTGSFAPLALAQLNLGLTLSAANFGFV